MSLAADLLSILACPKCKGEIKLSGNEKTLVCESCRLVYPIREGIPILLTEEASPVGKTEERMTEPDTSGGPGSQEFVRLVIVEGKDKGTTIELPKGSCRAVGRSLDDLQKTRVFSVESSVSLDDQSKKLVMAYIGKHFRKKGIGDEGPTTGSTIGGFRRGPDFPLADPAVSRLHAMIFCDEGGVGILDLVSRNGTFVNGVEVESKMLKRGDLITLGATKIRYEG